MLENPDVFLPASWLVSVLGVINSLRKSNVGIFTVPLFGYDFEKDMPNGLVDSFFDFFHEAIGYFKSKTNSYYGDVILSKNKKSYDG